MKEKKHESLEEILSEERDFTEEEIKARTAHTQKLFRILLLGASGMVLVLVALGIIFGR